MAARICLDKSSASIERKCRFLLAFIYLGYVSCESLDYDRILEAGSGVTFSLDQLASLDGDTLTRSLHVLGRERLKEDQARFLWDALLKLHDGDVSAVPDWQLQALGWIVAGIPAADIRNISFTEVDTVAAFGRFHALSSEQLEALAERVRTSWAAKEPEDYSHYDLAALSHILCGFSSDDLARIHGDAFRDAVSELRTLKRCPRRVLRDFAQLAMRSDAFGDAQFWDAAKVNALGCILSGVSDADVGRIPSTALEARDDGQALCEVADDAMPDVETTGTTPA